MLLMFEKLFIGSSVVYVTVGFPYSVKVWKENWPKLILNVIKVCKEHNCKLVFFDNIYMYDSNHLNGMTEETLSGRKWGQTFILDKLFVYLSRIKI